MALMKCSECGSDVSDKAAVCMKCGAPVSTEHRVNAVPVATVKPPKTFMWYWWLWGPIGAFVAFILFGLSIPKKTADANAFARVCSDLYAKGAVASMYDCNRVEQDIREGRRVLPDSGDRDAAAAIEAIRATHER